MSTGIEAMQGPIDERRSCCMGTLFKAMHGL
jgi:hypothetical protein